MALVDLGKSRLQGRGGLRFFVPQENQMAILFQGIAYLGSAPSSGVTQEVL
jgi:hypothetical protein